MEARAFEAVEMYVLELLMKGKAMYNPYENMLSVLDRAAGLLGLKESNYIALWYPERELKVSIPVEMDDGSIKVFEGYRVQHSTSRGPCKGGIRYHQNVDIVESARLDGCNDIRIFYRIVLPLSAQILAIIAMFNAVGFWNQYFTSMVFAPKTSITPLQIMLMNILLQGQLQDSAQQSLDPQLEGQRMYYYMQLKYVVILFAILPIMCAYPFIQKYFVQGVMIGAIKE